MRLSRELSSFKGVRHFWQCSLDMLSVRVVFCCGVVAVDDTIATLRILEVEFMQGCADKRPIRVYALVQL